MSEKDWKWEYENLCKFADKFQDERDHLKSLLTECREVLEFYGDKTIYGYRPRFPDTKQMEISFDRGTKARKMLGKLKEIKK
jgi:hypothetical protein